jgi:hypothetical protein
MPRPATQTYISRAGGVLGVLQPADESLAQTPRSSQAGDGATPSLTPSRKSARQEERRAAKVLRAQNGASSDDDDFERGGRISRAGRKKSRN